MPLVTTVVTISLVILGCVSTHTTPNRQDSRATASDHAEPPNAGDAAALCKEGMKGSAGTPVADLGKFASDVANH